MIKLPERINVADPATCGELKPYTAVQILVNIDQYNAAETAYLKACAAVQEQLAPYRNPESGLSIPLNAPAKVRELQTVMRLSHFNIQVRRFPNKNSKSPYFQGVAEWRRAAEQMQHIAARLNAILSDVSV